MTTLAAPKVALKLTPVPKTVLYAGLTGELLKNTGMKDDDQIRAVQQAVSEGLVEKVIVLAKDGKGHRERFELELKPFKGADTVDLHLEAGKSYLEALDVSLAASVQYAADLIARKGLTPTFHVAWSYRAKANPDIIKDAIKRLNLKVESEEPIKPAAPVYVAPTPSYSYTPPKPPERYPQAVHTYYDPPPPPPNHQWWTVAKVTPEKDPGVTFTISTTRPK